MPGTTASAGGPGRTHRALRLANRILLGILAALFLGLAGAMVYLSTDAGEERLRALVERQLNEAVEGEAEVGWLETDLLRGVRLGDVSIVDAQGRPFLEAEEIGVGWALLPLLSQEIILREVEVVRAHVVLDQPPGEEWNVMRIFEPDPDAEATAGWGDHLEFRNVELVDSRITVRMEWTPDPELTEGEQRARLDAALAGELPERVEPVPGGAQQIMEFRSIDARFPRILATSPEREEMLLEVEELAMVAEPFRPPGAVVQHLSGRFTLSDDSMAFEELEVEMPGTVILGRGTIRPGDEMLSVDMEVPSLAFQDLHFLHLPLPEAGDARLQLTVERDGPSIQLRADPVEVAVEGGRAVAQGEVRVLDGVIHLGEAEVRFEEVTTELLDELAPDLNLPWNGALSGTLTAEAAEPDAPNGLIAPFRLEGHVRFVEPEPDRVSEVRVEGMLQLAEEAVVVDDLTVQLEPLHLGLADPWIEEVPSGSTVSGPIRASGSTADGFEVTSELTLRSPGLAQSRVIAQGGIVVDEAVAFRGFQVEFDPVTADWVRVAAPAFPLDGVLSGFARLDGAPEPGMTFGAEIVHRGVRTDEEVVDPISHLDARGSVATSGRGRVDVGIRLHALSLATLGTLAPGMGLRGEVEGEIEVRGSFEELEVDVALEFPGDGQFGVEGRLGLGAPEPTYDLTFALDDVDFEALSTQVPAETNLTGAIHASGQGFDPATARATIETELSEQVGPAEIRVFRAGLALDGDGLLRVDSIDAWMGSLGEPEQLRIIASGDFGLTPEREGRLDVQVMVEFLEVLAPFLPSPGAPADEDDPAAEDPGRIEVRPGVTQEDVPLVGVARDAVTGSLQGEGVLRGNVEESDFEGEMDFQEVRLLGHYVGSGAANVRAEDIGGPALSAGFRARAQSLLLAGFGYDSLAVEATYEHGEPRAGTATVALHQSEGVSVQADGAFEVDPDQSGELRLEALSLAFPDLVYRLRDSAVVRWSPEEIQIEGLRLEGIARGLGLLTAEVGEGPLIHLDGRLPRDGDGDMDIQLRGFRLAHAMTLLQAGEAPPGLVALDLDASGTLSEPVLDGSVTVEGMWLENEPIPDSHIIFGYRDRTLAAQVTMEDDTGVWLTAEADLPVELGLVGVEGPRLPDEPFSLEIALENLPLDGFLGLAPQVEAMGAHAGGYLSLSGSYETPDADGLLELTLAELRLVPLGVGLRNTVGSIRVEDRTVVVDSIIGHSQGPIRIAGEVDLSTLTEPGFALSLQARNARVLDNEDGRLDVDADVSLDGPLTAMMMSGEIRTRQGVLYIPTTDDLAAGGAIDLEDPATFARADERLLAARDRLIDTSPALENFAGAIELHVPRDVWLRSTEANVEIHTPEETGPLMIRMNGVRPQDIMIEGTVAAVRGEYAFMGRRFDLAEGTVTFMGGPEPDPLIRLTAEHEVNLPGRELLDIRVVLDGTITDGLETELTSSAQPPLSQTDLLSYMVFGREAGSLLMMPSSALSGQGSTGGPPVGDVAARATQYMATAALEAAVAELELEAARATGLDVLHIQPAELPSEIFTGGYLDVLRGTEIQAGSYLTPRLFVSGQARPTLVHPGLLVEYETPGGYLWRTTWRPRFLPAAPTLGPDRPDQASVFGSFLFREWRF